MNTMKIHNNDTSKKDMRWTTHGVDRRKERGIEKKPINIDDIKKMPIYTTENGCTKYLDIINLLVYYVRGNNIVTAIKCVHQKGEDKGKPNPIQMLRYYAFSKKINFNTLCRDHVFNNCKRGDSCKYRHLEINAK
jgi:hypothetical protein